VVFFKESDGSVPVLQWLEDLRRRNEKAFAKCMVRVERLEQVGHELRRPEADILRDGIYELRARQGTVQYRILYFFHGKCVVVLTHALTKEERVPDAEIARAVKRMRIFESNPTAHTHEEVDDEHEQEHEDA
jgi:phage-related protein